MEKGIEIITVHLNNTNGLGLKIIFAKNKVNMEYYAVITEVNPFGICGKDQIVVGDILLSFDGVNIDSYETLLKLSTHNSENNKANQSIQLKIKKREAVEIAGLYSACLNTPCSEVCKIIEEWKPKVIPRKTVDNKIDLSTKTLSRPNDPKLYAGDLSPSTKKSTLSNIDDSRKHSVDNIKIKFQKAVPMRRKENPSRTYKATLKPKKSFKNNIIPPAQPTFIHRKINQNSDQVTNLKESTSLSNLNNENVDHSKQDSSSDSSSWDSSDSSSNKFVPKNKSGFDYNSSENPIDLKNNTNELEKSKRLSRSMDLLLSDLKQHPHVQNNKKKYDENILPS